MSDESGRRPAPGDRLVLDDGRPFELTETASAIGRWWFKARALDGRSFLQGNLWLEWNGTAEVWYPAPVREPARLRPVLRRPRIRRAQRI